MEFLRPVFGLYGACSTAGEALSLGAMTVAAGYADKVATVTSSHFAGAERQFRFPIEYANQRPLSSTWTVTGSGAYLLGSSAKFHKDMEQSHCKITEVTTGKIIDLGVRDAMNMGAAMAPAAAEVICTHLSDFGRSQQDYDAIITGDLGSVGQEILLGLCRQMGHPIDEVHLDCGMTIYDSEEQHTCAGGSGCGCAAVTMASYFLPKIAEGTWKRVLFVPTGALMSSVSFNEGQNVPGIAHSVMLEHET
jgi:stage V sporulation protein AD